MYLPRLNRLCTGNARISRIVMTMAAQRVKLVWIREKDLRIHDHEPLYTSFVDSKSSITLPFFCLDDQMLQPQQRSTLQTPSTGPFRICATLKAMHHLDSSLSDLGSRLLTSTGSTEHFISTILSILRDHSSPNLHLDHISLHYYTYPCNALDAPLAIQHENRVINSFINTALACGFLSFSVHPCWGATLYHPEDICTAFSSKRKIENTMDDKERMDVLNELLYSDIVVPYLHDTSVTMTGFRSKLQTETAVRKPFQSLSTISVMPVFPQTIIPSISGYFIENVAVLSSVYNNSLSIDALYKNAGAFASYERLQRLIYWDQHHDGQACPPNHLYYNDIDKDNHKREYTSNAFITEREALERLDSILSSNFMKKYKDTRMLCKGASSTAMLSCALSLGTISPRMVWWKTMHAVAEHLHKNGREKMVDIECSCIPWKDPAFKRNQVHDNAGGDDDGFVAGCMWLLMHLGIRDFFLLSNLGHPKQKHQQERDTSEWSRDLELFTKWAHGQTGIPFVDANMRQLALTGWMSNRGRQCVGSFLSKALRIDWMLGAELFHSLLIDHDFGVNFQNWKYIAGVGADPRDRTFKTVTQGEKYDPNAEFIDAFVKEVCHLEIELKHRPWLMVGADSDDVTLKYCRSTMVDPSSQIGAVKKKNK